MGYKLRQNGYSTVLSPPKKLLYAPPQKKKISGYAPGNHKVLQTICRVKKIKALNYKNDITVTARLQTNLLAKY